MSDKSTLLSLPYIQAAQAQKHVTHNEAIELLDAITQLGLEAVDATTPPASAAEGQAWGVGAGATGAWAGHGGDIAAWRGGGWLFITPHTGWVAWDKTNAALTVWTPTGWTAQGGVPDLDNLAGVGINASADTTNKLAVAADATLLSHDGAGHQVKINKAATGDTASLLYQTNWSGRAEMGLAGNDDFSIKVSADGSTFTEALRVDAASGAVRFPAGIAGSGSVAGALGLQAIAMTCERNTGFTIGSYLAFGNGATQPPGAAMPFSGRVVAASLAQNGAAAGINTVIMTLNRIEAPGYDVSVTSTGSGVETSTADFSAAPLTFAAGDALAMKITAASGTSNKSVGTFFVVFD